MRWVICIAMAILLLSVVGRRRGSGTPPASLVPMDQYLMRYRCHFHATLRQPFFMSSQLAIWPT